MYLVGSYIASTDVCLPAPIVLHVISTQVAACNDLPHIPCSVAARPNMIRPAQ
jgi:hypothetical protein